MPATFKCVLKIFLKVLSALFSRWALWPFLKRSVQDLFHIGGKILSIVHFGGWREGSLLISEKVNMRVGSRVFSQRIFGRKYWFFDYFFASIVDRVGIEDWISFFMLKSFDSFKTRCIPLETMKTVLIPFGYFDWIRLIKFFSLYTFFLFFIVILPVD